MDEKLIKALACPACKGDVKVEEKEVICLKCNKRYPIENGVPVLLVSRAK